MYVLIRNGQPVEWETVPGGRNLSVSDSHQTVVDVYGKPSGDVMLVDPAPAVCSDKLHVDSNWLAPGHESLFRIVLGNYTALQPVEWSVGKVTSSYFVRMKLLTRSDGDTEGRWVPCTRMCLKGDSVIAEQPNNQNCVFYQPGDVLTFSVKMSYEMLHSNPGNFILAVEVREGEKEE